MVNRNSTPTVEIRGKEEPVTNGYRLRKFAPERADRAKLLVAAGCVHLTGTLGEYFVESASEVMAGRRGIGYHVSLNTDTCQCPDYERGRNDALFACMHLEAAREWRRIMQASIRPQAVS